MDERILRRNSESPKSTTGSTWSLPDGKNPVKVLSRSMTSDTLLRNVVDPLHSSPNTAKALSIDYKEVEKYIVKSVCDKRVMRQNSDAVIVVKEMNRHGCLDHSVSDPEGKSQSFDQTHQESPTSASETFKPFSMASAAIFSTPKPSPPATPLLPQLSSYNCYKILESVYIGDLTTAVNKQLLCKLNVEYMLNIGGIDFTNLPSNLRSTVPCSCPSGTTHSQVQMCLYVDENTSIECLLDYFKEANQFINTARLQGKKILLFDREGMEKTGTFVIQYVMHYYGMKYFEAKAFVVNSSAEFAITENFDSALRVWEEEVCSCTSTASKPGTPTKESGKSSRPNSCTRADNRKIAWS